MVQLGKSFRSGASFQAHFAQFVARPQGSKTLIEADLLQAPPDIHNDLIVIKRKQAYL